MNVCMFYVHTTTTFHFHVYTVYFILPFQCFQTAKKHILDTVYNKHYDKGPLIDLKALTFVSKACILYLLVKKYIAISTSQNTFSAGSTYQNSSRIVDYLHSHI